MQKVLSFLINAFPVWIIICSTIALIKPEIFMWFAGEFITYGLGTIMLGMGLTLKPEDFLLNTLYTKFVRREYQIAAEITQLLTVNSY